MKRLLPNLTARLAQYKKEVHVKSFEFAVPKEDNEIISQAWFWPRMGKFFRAKDVLIAETGQSLILSLGLFTEK